MSSVDLSAALPQPGGLGSYYARVPIDLDLPTSKDLFRTLPGAARTVFQAIHALARKGREIDTTDREFTRLCGIGPRCVQKGLKQLEDLGLISRVRQHGGRIITFLVNFATKAAEKVHPKSGRKSEKPAGQPPSVPAATKEPEPEPPVSEEEAKEAAAALRAMMADVTASPGPEAPPEHHVGPSLRAAVPKLSEAERAHHQEEQKRRTDEWKAARKQASEAQASGQDQPAVLPAPLGSEEIARE
jgi:hypothetical protein